MTTEPTTEAPKVSTTEVLGYGVKKDIAGIDSITGLSASVKKGRELRAAKEKGAPARSIFHEMAESQDRSIFTSEDATTLTKRFGGGELDKDGTFKGTPSDESQKSHEAAVRIVEDLRDIVQYSDVLTTALGTTKEDVDIYTEKKLGTALEFTTLEGKVLGILVENDAIKKMFPELETITDPGLKTQIIKEAILRDPKLKEKLSQKLRDIAERAKNLPPVEDDPEMKEAKATKAKAEDEIVDNIAQISSTLAGLDIELSTTQKGLIETDIRNGRPPEAIIRDLNQRLTTEQPIYKDIIADQTTIQNYEKLQKEFLAATRQAHAKSIEHYETLLRTAKASFDIADARSKQPDHVANLNKAMAVYNLLNTSTPIFQEFQKAAQSGKNSNEADRIMERLKDKNDENIAQKKTERLRQEAQLRSELIGALSSSVATMMAERYDEAVLAKTTVDTEHADKDTKEALHHLHDAMRENWVKVNEGSRDKSVNNEQIGVDMRFLAYHGQDGVKRLMLRDMGLPLPRKNPDGTPMTNIDGAPLYHDWNTVNLDDLSDEQKKILTEAYASTGEAYKDKLMLDYFAARSMEGANKGTLKLEPEELAMIEKHFKGDMDKAINSNAEAKKIMEDLKKKGIIMTPNIKWLLYLMVILGLAATGVGIVGIAAPGVAAAGLALAVGTAQAAGSAMAAHPTATVTAIAGVMSAGIGRKKLNKRKVSEGTPSKSGAAPATKPAGAH